MPRIPCLATLLMLPMLLPGLPGATARAQAQAPMQAIEVDAELVLAVDVSRSMSPRELEIQRRGYAEALQSRPVIEAITSGLLGRVAITYIEWAGEGSQRTIVDWTLVEGRGDAQAIAGRLTARFNRALRRTSISGALTFAADLFDANGFTSSRRIIDISGDGPNNMGRPVAQARDAVLARGITINGLPLTTRGADAGPGRRFDIDDLESYYRDCVIGGPGAFVMPVRAWDEFPAAVRRKLVMELAAAAATPLPVQARPPADCMIGEKIWEIIRQRWFMR